MPISGPSSYPPTLGEFFSHWTAVNVELDIDGPLVLPSGVDVSALVSYRDSLEAFAESVEGLTNDREIARGTIEQNKQLLLDRLGEFNRKVRAVLGHTAYVRALPRSPTPSSREGKILRPLNDMQSLWQKINAATISGFTGPLMLLSAYDAATFETELDALQTAYHNYQDSAQQLVLERKRRDELQDTAHDAMRDYRLGVAALFPPEHPLVESLPHLSPPSGGGGPAPAAPTIINWFAAGAGMITIDWTDVDGADLYIVARQIVGVDTEFVDETDTFTESEATFGIFPTESTVHIKVRAVDDTIEGPDSNVVSVVVPIE